MEFLINIALKSTLILLFSGLILLSLKKASATLRHWIISLTMIGLLLLPLLVAFIPDMKVTVPYLPPNEVVAEMEEKVAVPLEVQPTLKPIETSIPLITENLIVPPARATEVIDNQEYSFIQSEPSRFEEPSISVIQLVPLIWLFGFGFFLLRFCLGLFGIRKITINSVPFVLPKGLQSVPPFYTKKPIRILVNPTIKTPMTWGGFRPVILLPKAASDWSTTELKTVLIHELNHIKRNDYWIHSLGLLAVCFYWCHPLIWLMKRQQLLEREKACDEAVLRAGIRQQNYAEQLVSIARQLSTNRSMIGENALPMAKMSQTKSRVLAILSFDDERFQFSAWKQRNWGLLYVLLFPILAAFSPVGKELMNTSFELPKLEDINHYLAIDGLTSESINSNFSTNSPFDNLSDNKLTELKEDFLPNQPISSLDDKEIAPLESLRNQSFTVPINQSVEPINIPHKKLKAGLYGNWKDGKSEFKVWTYGDFKLIPTAPFIEPVSDDGIIFIEEYIPGIFRGKNNQLILAKAPYDCRIRPSYKKTMDTRPEGLIKKGDPIKIWSENTNYNRWINTKGKRLVQHLRDKKKDYVVQEINYENNDWGSRIKSAKEWIDFNFWSVEMVEAKMERVRKRALLKAGNIPFAQLTYPKQAGQPSIIGKTTLSGNDVGSMNYGLKGTQYITVLKGNKQPALVKGFNFHLSRNDYKNLVFDLQLYNLVDGNIAHSITKSPIPITVQSGNGWVKVDLSNYGIVTEGEVLVVLENKDHSGTKKGKNLYFSLTDNHQVYQHIISANYEWKTKRILERDFIMYLDVEQPLEVSENLEDGRENGALGYFIKWKDGKNSYKVWTYGDFKTYQKAPYIEVLSPDGMVVIELIENKMVSNKTCLFVITKAPHNGLFVQNFKDGEINNFVGDIKKNDPLFLLPANKKNWVFLSTIEDGWGEENLPNIFWELGRLTTGNSDYQPTTEKDTEWWSVIQAQQAIIANRFRVLTTNFENEEELKAKGIRGVKLSNRKASRIMANAIDKIADNYIQQPHSANLFYKYSSFNKFDSLGYQSESVLKYYDSKGYKKGGWRNVTAARYAQLEQSRIIVGDDKNRKELYEIGQIPVFWSHEPIITHDKPLSEKSFYANAYDYKLIGTTTFGGKEVFEISFVCTKLKNKFAGLPSLKYMKGRIYINKEDFAILKYEQEYLMDYDFTGKHPKKRGHLKERNIIHSSRVEIFAKSKDGYYLESANITNNIKNEHTLLDGTIDKKEGNYLEEYQYSGITTNSVTPLTEKLFKINDQAKYNPDYWRTIDLGMSSNTTIIPSSETSHKGF